MTVKELLRGLIWITLADLSLVLSMYPQTGDPVHFTFRRQRLDFDCRGLETPACSRKAGQQLHHTPQIPAVTETRHSGGYIS